MKKFLFLSSVFILPVASGVFIFIDLIEKKLYKTNKETDSTRFGMQDYGKKWGAKTDEIVNLKVDKEKRLNKKSKQEI